MIKRLPNQDMTNSRQREKAIKDLLLQFSQCGGSTFDCQDPSAQFDKFEQRSKLDFKPVPAEQTIHIKSFLKLRAKINLKIKIAESMLKRLANYSTKV